MKRSTLKRRERSRTLSSLLHTYEKRQGSPEMASKRQKKSSPKAKRLRFWRLASRSKSPVGEQVSAWDVMKARKKLFWQEKLRRFSETSTETSPCWDLCKLTSKQRYWTLHMWNSQNESNARYLSPAGQRLRLTFYCCWHLFPRERCCSSMLRPTLSHLPTQIRSTKYRPFSKRCSPAQSFGAKVQ